MRQRLFVLIAITGIAVVCVLLLLGHRTEVARTSSPDGTFQAVTTVSSWRRSIPVMPGQSGDQPCYVEILRADGASMGELPVDMVQIAVVEWTSDGAQIKLVGGWDFVKGLCWHWDRDQTRYTYVKGHAP